MAARTRRRRRTGAAPRCTEDRAAETAKPAKKNDSSGQPARKSSQVFGTTAPATMPAAMRHGAHGRHRPGSLILSYKEQAKFNKAFGGAARSNDRCHCQDRVLAVPVAVKRRPRSHTRADTTTSCFAHARRPRHPGRRHPSHRLLHRCAPSARGLGRPRRVLQRGPRRHRRLHVHSYYNRFDGTAYGRTTEGHGYYTTTLD